MTVGIPNGNALVIAVIDATITPSGVATVTAPAQTFTVPGVLPGDVIASVTPPAQQAGVTIGSAFVSAADTVSIQFVNTTAGSVTPSAGLHKFTVIRPDRALTRVSL